MDPWNTMKAEIDNNPNGDPSLHQLLASTSFNVKPSASASQGVSSGSSKRVVCPAVPFMTVKEERKCLSEIRNYNGPIPENFVLSNGMKAEDFALMYVLGHQLKRKEKQSSAANG
jgi:hypothetical protein